MNAEPGWIEISEVIALNRGAVALTGETHALINLNALDSAVMSPRNLFHYENEADLGVLACRLIVAVSRAHAFLQGNKRTAWLSGVMFLNINGYDIVLPSLKVNALIASQITSVIKRELSDEDFLLLLDPFIVAI